MEKDKDKKEEKKEEKIKPQFFRQNIYAVKMLWSLSPRRVIHTVIQVALDYFGWLFSSLFFLRYIIRAIETGADFSSAIGFIIFACFLMGGLLLYMSYANNVVFSITWHTVFRDLYAKIYHKARNVELRCYEDSDFYNKYTMALENANGRIIQTAVTFISIIGGIIASGIAFYVMFTIDPFSVLFIASPIIGNFLFGSLISKIEAARYAENTPHNRKIGYVKRVLYLAEFAKEVRMSNIFSLMSRRYDESVGDLRKVADKYAAKGTFFQATKHILTFAFVFQGILFYAAYRGIVSQTMPLADLAIIFSAMTTTSWLFIGLFGDVSASLGHVVFVNYLRGFLEYKEEIPEDQDGIKPDSRVNSIEFKNVTFEYKSGFCAIKDCSFVIKSSQIVAFAGHNGAGKSTLMKLLFRLYDPTAGEILVNGINIKEYNLQAYRSLFSAAFQDYKIFSMSVEDNVTLGRDKTKVESALKQAGVWEEIKSLSNGVNTTLTKEFDENGAVLSEGNAQKVVVARAFANSAQIQVYDEPSSALDPIAEYNMYKSIMSASRGVTTLFISHRLSSVADADIILVMEQGQIIERGNHKELMALGGEYARMYTMQARSYLADSEAVVS